MCAPKELAWLLATRLILEVDWNTDFGVSKSSVIARVGSKIKGRFFFELLGYKQNAFDM